jgi:RimJ/RimL family protein N-acetyltransferase
MSHTIIVERYGIRIRPVTLDDATFIHSLRRSPELSQYIGEVDAQLSVHQQWLAQYMQRDDDYYFCIELLTGQSVGTISIYNVRNGVGNWGRWMLSPLVPAAAASVWLIMHVAFDILGLSEVYSNTVIDNERVVSFHDSCGFERAGVERNGITIRGVSYDMIIHRVKRDNWPVIQGVLEKPAVLTERLLKEDG